MYRNVLDSRIGIFVSAVLILVLSASAAAQFKVLKKFPLEGGGRWDYVTVDGTAHRLYIARSTHFSVLDTESGAIVGDIADTPGAHGIAVVPNLGIGFTSNGREGKVSVVDLKTLKVLSKIDTGENPDSIVFHPPTGTVFVQNGKSNSTSVIDTASKKVIATIPLGGKPEFAVYDDGGRFFINLEDKGAIVVVDAAKRKVKATWPVAGCEEPSGLAIDRKNHTLFSACSNKLLAVVDSESGKLIQTLPIGEDCDAVVFDPETGFIFASNGDGKLTVAHKAQSGKYEVVQNLETRAGSKTMALDASTHKIYLPSAKFTGEPTAHPRPSVVEGSVEVLVVGK